MDIRPEVLGQSARGTAATHPTIQGNATIARELGESRKESARLSVREYVNITSVSKTTLEGEEVESEPHAS